jgi:hypothetical protein
MSTYLGDPAQDAMRIKQAALKRRNEVVFDLLMLLVKLDVCPGVVYEDTVYPMNHNTSQFRDWYHKRRFLQP